MATDCLVDPYRRDLFTTDDSRLSRDLARGYGIGAVIARRLEYPLSEEHAVPRTLALFTATWAESHCATAYERLVFESASDLTNVILVAQIAERDGGIRASTQRSPSRAERDSLTGLLVHSAFHRRLAHMTARAQRHGEPLSLAIIDIDHFRTINERFGYDIGDRVLAALATRIAARTGPRDAIARLGRDEIAWLMPVSALAARAVVNRMRASLGRGSSGYLSVRFTVSVGICDLTRACDGESLLRHAQGALYWAKRHGHDQISIYDPSIVTTRSDRERVRQLAARQTLRSVRLLARIVDAKDSNTRSHSERVASIAALLAERLGWDADRQELLHQAALVHDVGKIVVSDAVLAKPGRLTDDEYREMKRHALVGAEIVADVLSADQVSWVRGHHEHWDGAGYPDRLTAEAIPEGAQILAVADAWDVMTSTRPYHQPMSFLDALAECRRCVGRQFSPRVVGALSDLLDPGPPPVGWPTKEPVPRGGSVTVT